MAEATPMLSLDTKAVTIQTVYNWYSKGFFRVNRRYQRKLVWTLEEKQELISSIYREYPIPAIILSQDADGHYEIIDGMQRLHAITSFIEQSYADLNGHYFNIDEYPTVRNRMLELFGNEEGSEDDEKDSEGDVEFGDDFELIDADAVSSVLEYNIPISVLNNATDERVDDVFRRINSYGHQLSSQERRQAGVTGIFADTVRKISSILRQDSTPDVESLEKIPEVEIQLGLDEMEDHSIDLPSQNQGYSIAAEDTFWVRAGVLNAKEIRDSKDEECVADIVASVLLEGPVTRSKDALDEIYDSESEIHLRVENALRVHGEERLTRELLFCFDCVDRLSEAAGVKIKRLMYSGRTGKVKNSNSFPNVFGAMMFEFYRMLISDSKNISDFDSAVDSLEKIADQLDSSQAAAQGPGRRKIAKSFRGQLSDCLVDATDEQRSFISSGIEIEQIIRHSQVELARLEFKQGVLNLGTSRSIDKEHVSRVIETICAIANCGPDSSGSSGSVVIGVADKGADAERVRDLDGVPVDKIGQKFVVGIDRELRGLSWDLEEYLQFWRDAILSSELTESLKVSTVNSMEFSMIHGKNVLVINIDGQSSPSSVGKSFYERRGDQTFELDPSEYQRLWARFSS